MAALNEVFIVFSSGRCRVLTPTQIPQVTDRWILFAKKGGGSLKIYLANVDYIETFEEEKDG